MSKDQVIKDVSALIKGSDSPEQAGEVVRKYFCATQTFIDLAHWAKVNNHVPGGKMQAQGEEDFEFGGGGFGGGGATGKW